MTKDGVYFEEVEIADVKCFKGTHKISFTKPNGEPQQWNVILGNNNTGKTTILKVLASLEPEQLNIMESKESYIIPTHTINSEINSNHLIISKLGNLKWGIDNKKGELTVFAAKKGSGEFKKIENSFFLGYGISRKISETNLSNSENENENLAGIFQDDIRYTNPEEWLFQLELVASKGDINSKNLFDRVKEILTSD